MWSELFHRAREGAAIDSLQLDGHAHATPVAYDLFNVGVGGIPIDSDALAKAHVVIRVAPMWNAAPD